MKAERILKIIKEELNLNELSLNEVKEIDDFFYFLENDPRLNTFSWLHYTSKLNGGLAKPKNNPMFDRILKFTKYKFNFGHTYRKKAENLDPDYVAKKRKGDYSKVQGYNVLEFDKQGNLALPIMPLETKSFIAILDENDNPMDEISPRDLKEKYGEYFKPSFFTDYRRSDRPDFRALKIDSVSRIAAGGAIWENPHFKFMEYKDLARKLY